jgi:Protein of unknown function (DUF1501)
MLSFQGDPTRLDNGSTRREALRLGGLSLFGIGLDGLLRAEEAQAQPRRGTRAKSVVLLYLFGGPSLHETFDPKPDAPAEIRGEFGSVRTSVPGVHFCEHLPRMAKWMHCSTLIRSATHEQNDHSAGLLYTMSGSPASSMVSDLPILPTQAPGMSSTVEYMARDERRAIPASFWMPCPPGWGQKITRPGPYGGFLGRKYDPFFPACELEDRYKPNNFYDVRGSCPGSVRAPGTTLPVEISKERFASRKALLAELDTKAKELESSAGRFDEYQQKAMEVLLLGQGKNNPWMAFDLDEEPRAVQERYGKHLYGRCALIARRLVERDVRFVTVSWESFEAEQADPSAWDTHERHFPILRDHRLPVLDQVYSALCEDLEARGLLQETLVIVMGEMGRTPKINGAGGRDHWSYCHNILLTGGAVQQGLVWGSSDSKGYRPTSNPVRPEDLVATIYEALGIDPFGVVPDVDGRPRPLLSNGAPIRKILA